MSYATIAQCARDMALFERVTAASAAELAALDSSLHPSTVANLVIWPLSSAADIEAAYASALAAGNPNPGGDETVVTDGMILANVQAHWPDPLPGGMGTPP
jgi:hypothetical protein